MARYQIDYFIQDRVKCPSGKEINDYLGDFYDFSYSSMENYLAIETNSEHEIFEIAKSNGWPLPVLIAANNFGLEFMFTEIYYDDGKRCEDGDIVWESIKGNVFIPWGAIKNLHGIMNSAEFGEIEPDRNKKNWRYREK